jgi:predicted kinase
MDLDHLGRADLSQAFVDAYVRDSGDSDLKKLLDFYKCYRAFVRGKVLGFRLSERALPHADRTRIEAESRAYFDLAMSYATANQRGPVLLVTMGLPASGKTTLARSLASRMALVHLSSDVVRKELIGARATTHHAVGFQRGLYSRGMTRRTYAALIRRAARWLRRGRSVVLDATFGQRTERTAVRQLARRTGARLMVVVTETDEAVIRERLARRAEDARSVSDARLELWPALRAAFAEPSELSDALHVDASRPLEQVALEVLHALRRPDGSVVRAA